MSGFVAPLNGLNKILCITFVVELNYYGGFTIFLEFADCEAVRAPSDLFNLLDHLISAQVLRAELDTNSRGDETPIKCDVSSHIHGAICLVLEGTVHVPPIECEPFLHWLLWIWNG